MDLQAAEKAIRQGAWAGFLVTGITLLVVTVAVVADAGGRFKVWNDPWNFIDVALVAGLSFGVWKRSRASAICLFVYFVASKIIIFVETGQASQIVMSVIFLYFFGRAALGAFAWHRIRREQDPEYRPVRKAMYLLWIPGGLAGVIFFGLLTIGLLGPSTAVQTGDQISPDDVALLRAEGIVDGDERIVMLYSAGLFSVREEGNVITDRRVISYEEFEDEIWLMSTAFEDIQAVSVEETGDFLSDTVIMVTPNVGEQYLLFASTENGGDERFVAEIRNRMN